MKARLTLHALTTARPRQLGARAVAPLRLRRFPSIRSIRRFRPIVSAESLWRSDAFASSEDVLGEGVVHVLGLDVPFSPIDWRLPGEARLRRFHLHYGDEVLALARRADGDGARRALHAWIDANPPRRSDSWHPYVVSTRICNWTAALSLLPELADPRVVASLQLQLAYLERNVEDGVLGNHVIRNACALVVGGIAFDDAKLAQQGLALLAREVPDQVLGDGGHYERSPVYHAVVLRDLLVAQAAAGLGWLDEPLERMRRFAAALRRPDGEPALFNDAPLDLAPHLELPEPTAGVSVFADTGYVVVRENDLWLAFDCGPPAPDFLPAHAHADALSVQVWVGDQPLLADSGTYSYEPGAERDFFRGTGAHSTVLVDARDQFELWGAFRSGPLPSVRLERADGRELVAVARYRGIRHERRVSWDDRELRLEDSLAGAIEQSVESRLVTAPGVELHANAVDAGELDLAEGWVSERFFDRQRASIRRARRPGAGELAWHVELNPVRKVSS